MRGEVVPPTGLAGSPSRGETGIDGIDGDVGWKGCPGDPGKTDLCPGARGTLLSALEEVEYTLSGGYAGERNIL